MTFEQWGVDSTWSLKEPLTTKMFWPKREALVALLLCCFVLVLVCLFFLFCFPNPYLQMGSPLRSVRTSTEFDAACAQFVAHFVAHTLSTLFDHNKDRYSYRVAIALRIHSKENSIYCISNTSQNKPKQAKTGQNRPKQAKTSQNKPKQAKTKTSQNKPEQARTSQTQAKTSQNKPKKAKTSKNKPKQAQNKPKTKIDTF